MGPEELLLGSMNPKSTRDNKAPPRYDGFSGSRKNCRLDALLWGNLAETPKAKRAFALIGRIGGEPKAHAKAINIATLGSDDGLTEALERLDKARQLGDEDQLGLGLADFLDFRRDASMGMELFVSGFFSRLGSLSALQISKALQGHLMSPQAGLTQQERSLVVGASSGSWEVTKISIALRQLFRKNAAYLRPLLLSLLLRAA